MGCEVEVKAHVQDPQQLYQRIVAAWPTAAPPVSEHKSDIYWSLAQGSPLFRSRMEETPSGRQIVVTRKDKQRGGALEVNHEIEFAVATSDGQSLQEFFTSLGYVVYIEKRKDGWIWDLAFADIPYPCHLELVDVTSLGWFVEIEFLLPDGSSDAAIADAQSKLMQMLQTLDIPAGALEPRYYMDLLKEQALLQH